MTWEDRLNAIQVGDTVRFRRRSLRDIFKGEVKLSPEGIVTGIEERDGFRFATVNWMEPGVPDKVNVLNLTKEREMGISERN